MFPANGLESNNRIIEEFLNHAKLHEHDFMLIRNEKEQTSIICSICGLVYCEKCGKLVMIYGKSYMHKNIYN
jgi:hypothetical protein